MRHCGNLDSIQLIGNYNSSKTAGIVSGPNLREFALWGYMSSNVSESLTCSLRHCKHLEGLAFFGADFENVSDLPTVLSQSASMNKPVLCKCNLKSEDASNLATGHSNSKLDILNLFCNDIKPEGMRALAGVVVHQELNLHACNIESDVLCMLLLP